MTTERFGLVETPLRGLTVLERRPIGDSRGFLERIFCANELREILGGRALAQINRTLTTRRGTVRGLHFQEPPHAEIKLVSCLRGKIFDVAVDLRRGSPTFLRWHSELLSADNHRTLVIPEGFAHGFQSLTDDVELLYLHTAAHHPAAERGFRADDATLAIRWPEPITDRSERDAAHPLLTSDFDGVSV